MLVLVVNVDEIDNNNSYNQGDNIQKYQQYLR